MVTSTALVHYSLYIFVEHHDITPPSRSLVPAIPVLDGPPPSDILYDQTSEFSYVDAGPTDVYDFGDDCLYQINQNSEFGDLSKYDEYDTQCSDDQWTDQSRYGGDLCKYGESFFLTNNTVRANGLIEVGMTVTMCIMTVNKCTMVTTLLRGSILTST